jgi:hypothetical protein
MVSKCANPDCSTPFLYFRRGRLFRVEVQPGMELDEDLEGEVSGRKPARRIEFFWLCGECAATMTLNVQKGSGVALRTRVRAAGL